MKKALVASAILLCSHTAFAAENQWNAGISYFNLSEDINLYSNETISLGGVVGHINYSYPVSDQFSIVPDVRLGTGLLDDSIDFIYGTELDIDLELFAALSVRAQYDFNKQFYGFIAPSYAYARIGVEYDGYTESEGDWDSGIGGGIGYKFSDTAAAEFRYESYSGTNAVMAGFSFNF